MFTFRVKSHRPWSWGLVTQQSDVFKLLTFKELNS